MHGGQYAAVCGHIRSHFCNHYEHLFIIHLFKQSEQLIVRPDLKHKLHS